MKKLAIRIAFLSLILFVAVPIFRTQVKIHKLSGKTEQLEKEISYVSDKVDYTKAKLDRIKNGDKDILSEYARDNFGYYDPDEEMLYNNMTD